VTPESDITVRAARREDIEEIHNILAQAFALYRKDYTGSAYNKTVVQVNEIARKLDDSSKMVFVVEFQEKIVGTAAVDVSQGSFYIQSMAVRPDVQRRGIGIVILKEIEKYARERGITILSLECYEPLTKAIELYEKFGFVRTGRSRAYHGITIFEMAKGVERCCT
jgi:ribosomal protein S18 acetylase RimI-like enzyme